MLSRRFVSSCSVVLAAIIAGCGAHDTSSGTNAMGGAAGVPVVTAGAGGGGGGGQNTSGAPGAVAANADCTVIDAAAYASMLPVSFRDDVLPILGFSCTASDCHRPSDHRAGLILGFRCTPDPSAKWKCRFPAMPTADMDDTQPQPDDASLVAMIRASLLAPATTVNGGAVARVLPMHPEKSFLVQKLAGSQNAQGYACTNQDPSHDDVDPATGKAAPCGDAMPLRGDAWCQSSSRPRFDAIAAWIAQGAPDG